MVMICIVNTTNQIFLITNTNGSPNNHITNTNGSSNGFPSNNHTNGSPNNHIINFNSNGSLN